MMLIYVSYSHSREIGSVSSNDYDEFAAENGNFEGWNGEKGRRIGRYREIHGSVSSTRGFRSLGRLEKQRGHEVWHETNPAP